MPKRAPFPRRSKERDTEEESRALFAAAVAPWEVAREHVDYGIDARVHLTHSDGDGALVTGRRFAVQLKAHKAERRRKANGASPRVAVKTMHLRYWRNSPEPVMLVDCTLPDGPMYYAWVDDELLARVNAASPRWVEQSTVTIELDPAQRIEPRALDEIRGYVVAWRRRDLVSIPAGAYLELYTKAQDVCSRLDAIAKSLDVASVPAELVAIQQRIQKATYLVAIAGPSRAGKSSLLNVLVGREVSPVATIPTTAVPMIVLPGADDRGVVEFADGRRQVVEPDASAVREFATQDGNPDNCKGVRLVRLELRHPLLQPGIGLFDLPGLDDADSAISARSLDVLNGVNAVIYVVDASPARSGGFHLNRYVVEDLRRLADVADRLFLVCNKVDELDKIQRREVLTQVERTLERFHLRDALPAKPMMVSAGKALEAQRRGRDPGDALSGLQNAVWGFLLQRGNTGIDRLASVLGSAATATLRTQDLLELRLARGVRGRELQDAIAWATEQRALLETWMAEEIGVQRSQTELLLGERMNQIIQDLDNWITKIPLKASFPKNGEIHGRVVSLCREAHRSIWTTRAIWWRSTDAAVNQKVTNAIRLAGDSLREKASPRANALPPMAALDLQVLDTHDDALTGLFFGVLLDLAFGSKGILSLLGWLFGVDVGAEKKRKKQTAKVLSHIKERLPAFFAELAKHLRQNLDEIRNTWTKTISELMGTYVADLQRVIDTDADPITKEDEATILAARDTLGGIADELKTLRESLDSLGDGIDPTGNGAV